MAHFSVEDFIHLGIDEGVEKAEWKISLDAENTQVIITDTVEGGHHNIEWIHNMRLMFNPLHPEMDMETINNGIGIYWNGDSSIYVSVKITMSGVESKWYQKVWNPPFYTEDNLIRRLSNPLDLDRIQNYHTHSPRTL